MPVFTSKCHRHGKYSYLPAFCQPCSITCMDVDTSFLSLLFLSLSLPLSLRIKCMLWHVCVYLRLEILYTHKHERLKRCRAEVDAKPKLLCIDVGATCLRGSCASGKLQRIHYIFIFLNRSNYLPVSFPQFPLFSLSCAVINIYIHKGQFRNLC